MAAIKRHFCFMLNRSGKFNSNFCRNWNRPKSGGLVAAVKLRAVSVTSQEKGLFLHANKLADLQSCSRQR
jgi:hypothetical protein